MAARFPIVPGGVQVVHFEITPGETVLDPRPTSLWVEGVGAFTILDESGVELEYNNLSPTPYPFSPVAVTAADTGVRILGWGRTEA